MQLGLQIMFSRCFALQFPIFPLKQGPQPMVCGPVLGHGTGWQTSPLAVALPCGYYWPHLRMRGCTRTTTSIMQAQRPVCTCMWAPAAHLCRCLQPICMCGRHTTHVRMHVLVLLPCISLLFPSLPGREAGKVGEFCTKASTLDRCSSLKCLSQKMKHQHQSFNFHFNK